MMTTVIVEEDRSERLVKVYRHTAEMLAQMRWTRDGKKSTRISLIDAIVRKAYSDWREENIDEAQYE